MAQRPLPAGVLSPPKTPAGAGLFNLRRRVMLRAVIHAGTHRFHFSGEVSGYNLEMLREHVRRSLMEAVPVHLRVAIEPSDERAFTRFGNRWFRSASERPGLRVQVVQLR